MNFPSREIVERLRQEYPAGCRIVLDEMDVPGWAHVKTDTVDGYVMTSYIEKVN